MADARKVALIHATPASVEPAQRAFAEEFPSARTWNLVDDGLAGDADRAGGLTPRLCDRMLRLIEHAVAGRADAVLLTCSVYGPVLRVATTRWSVPMAASDDAMFDLLAREPLRRVGLLGSLATSVADSRRRLAEHLGDARGVEVVGAVCDGAVEASRTGDREALLRALALGARAVGPVDAYALCQFSLAPVAEQLEAVLAAPLFSAPRVAARTLRARLG